MSWGRWGRVGLITFVSVLVGLQIAPAIAEPTEVSGATPVPAFMSGEVKFRTFTLRVTAVSVPDPTATTGVVVTATRIPDGGGAPTVGQAVTSVEASGFSYRLEGHYYTLGLKVQVPGIGLIESMLYTQAPPGLLAPAQSHELGFGFQAAVRGHHGQTPGSFFNLEGDKGAPRKFVWGPPSTASAYATPPALPA